MPKSKFKMPKMRWRLSFMKWTLGCNSDKRWTKYIASQIQLMARAFIREHVNKCDQGPNP